MTNAVSIRCPLCKSKDQSMDVLHVQWAAAAPVQMRSKAGQAYYLSLRCKGCSGYNSATLVLRRVDGQSVESLVFSGSSQYDLTQYLREVILQSPKPETSISEVVPQPVREALMDAYDAERPRARCTHFRSAVEFSLRCAGIEAKSGSSLGGILATASKSYAIPPPLIELCDQIKAFGNWGLHWMETEIDSEDAEAAQTITEAIVSYLFELPALVAAAATRTDAAKQAHHQA